MNSWKGQTRFHCGFYLHELCVRTLGIVVFLDILRGPQIVSILDEDFLRYLQLSRQ